MSLVYNTISTIWKSAQYFCLLVLLTIAFDINRGCGLEYSFWLVLWYLPNTVLRRYSNHSTIKLLRTSLSISEPLVLVGLLAFTALRTSQAGYEPGLFKLWEYVISISDPLFSLCEGVGTILIIQRSSQIVRKLAQKSDGYQIGFLVLSASMYVMSGYGLYRLYAGSAPELVPSVLSASLIGCVMTLTLTLSIVTLISQRGVVTDTAGLFAYMTFAMYIASRIETFQHMERVKLEPANTTFATQPLPILQSMTVDEMNRMLVRAALYTMQLVDALFKTLAPSVLVGLLYRMVVVLTVSQIASGLTAGNSLEQVPRQRSSSNDGDKGDHDSDENSNSLIPSLASLAKPALLVTHSRILLQHFGYTYPTPALWNWLNAFLCLALYAAELVLARDDAWEQY